MHRDQIVSAAEEIERAYMERGPNMTDNIVRAREKFDESLRKAFPSVSGDKLYNVGSVEDMVSRYMRGTASYVQVWHII